MIRALRLLLFPFSLLYGFAIAVRNYLYDKRVFKSAEFNIPVIAVGNLVAGGAGKSPMTEYIARLLKSNSRPAILSRGYGRSTKGFCLVEQGSLASEVGDEPLQFKRKFPELAVAVCEDRATGIERLMPENEIVILDDAYQHRSVKAGLTILLFDYTNLFHTQWLLPTGNLREPLSQRKRADIIVVTKTPVKLGEPDQERIAERVRPLPGQHLFFSYLEYGNLVELYGTGAMPLSEVSPKHSIALLTGIANPAPLVTRLKQATERLTHHRYADHHAYSTKNIAKLAESFLQNTAALKIIITTEKDAQRLHLPEIKELLQPLPVYYLPITARIHSDGEAKFNHIIESYVAR